MAEEKLVEIRCPFLRKSKTDDRMHKCNHLCIKVYPGSGGEAWCSSCKLTFEFSVDNQSTSETHVVAKSVN